MAYDDLVSSIFGPGTQNLTYEQLKQRRAIAAAIAGRARKFPTNIGEGIASLGENIGDILEDRRLRSAESAQAARDRASENYPGVPASSVSIPPPTGPTSTPPAVAATTAADLTPDERAAGVVPSDVNVDAGVSLAGPAAGARSSDAGGPGGYAGAIGGIESGGQRDPYKAVGVPTKYGPALGKFGIVEANVRPWSQAALGQPLTREQFLNNPQAQEDIFQHRFGQYANKYGPERAARAWYAGEGGMNNLGATDVHGRLNVQQYGQDFMRRLGGPGGPPPGPGADAGALQDPRGAATAALMQQPQSGLLGAPTAMAGGGTASDAPPIGVPTGPGTRDSIAGTIAGPPPMPTPRPPGGPGQMVPPPAPPQPPPPVGASVAPPAPPELAPPALSGATAQAPMPGIMSDAALGPSQRFQPGPAAAALPVPPRPPSPAPDQGIKPAPPYQAPMPGDFTPAPHPGAEPTRLGPVPMNQDQLHALRESRNPYLSDAQREKHKTVFELEERKRQRVEQQQETDFTHGRTQHEKKVEAFRQNPIEQAKFDIQKLTIAKENAQALNRPLEAQELQLKIDNANAALDKALYERSQRPLEREIKEAERTSAQQRAAAGVAPPHVTLDEKLVSWNQAAGEWQEQAPKMQPTEGGGAPQIKLSDSQYKELKFLNKMRTGLEQYNRIPNADEILASGLRDEIAGKIPFVGNAALRDTYRAARVASSAYINGQLRSESGAVIAADEFVRQYGDMFPIYGDDPRTRAQKSEQRESAAHVMYLGLGKARVLDDFAREERKQKYEAEQDKKIPDGSVKSDNFTGKKQIKRNGKWEDIP